MVATDTTDDAVLRRRGGGRSRKWLAGAVAALVAVLVVGAVAAMVVSRRASTGSAMWDIDLNTPPASNSSTFTALVHRVGCASGRTGSVGQPQVVADDNEVVITFSVEALPVPGDYTCLGNDSVPYAIDIGQPIGDRALIDGQCRVPETAYLCKDNDGIRWRADGRGFLKGNFSVKGRMTAASASGQASAVSGTVRASDPTGVVIASAETNPDGTFELALPNGTYSITGRAVAQCAARNPVVVKDRYVDAVIVECDS